METVGGNGREGVKSRKESIRFGLGVENGRVELGMGHPNLTREFKLSGAN